MFGGERVFTDQCNFSFKGQCGDLYQITFVKSLLALEILSMFPEVHKSEFFQYTIKVL